MRDLPSAPSLADAPPDHLTGHVWVQELLDGAAVRFAVAPAGYLRLGDSDRVYDEAPPALGYAARFLEEQFDLSAYLDSVDRPDRYTFVGVAAHHRSVDYDWDRLPAVLGTAVWDDTERRWLPPDRVESVFERLGPPPVNTVERERSVEREPLDGYEVPPSAWRDGAAAGVTVVDKRGHRAIVRRDDVPPEPPSVRVETADASELATRLVTDDLLDVRARALREDSGRDAVAFDPLFEAVLDRLVRAHHGLLFRGVTDTGSADLDWGRFRGAVAERVRRWLGDG